MYQLPTQVKEHSEELMEVHKSSIIYNNMNIRLNDFEHEGSLIKITYANTTFFDSLITNRSMDYTFAGKSLREIYEPGPFLSTLPESKLSNHLGFNGFLELADNKIIFVHRSDNVSIGKNTLATSVGASFKAIYGFDDDRCITNKTLANTIRMEIKNELKIDVPETNRFDQSIFAFYRDIVEGGKPQFLFYIKLFDIKVGDFERNFYKTTKGKSKKKLNCCKDVTDGCKFEYFSIDELRSFTYNQRGFTTPDGVKYLMMPSCIVSIILLLQATNDM